MVASDTPRKERRRWGLSAASAIAMSVALVVQAGEGPSDAVLARDLAASCAACHGTQGRSAGGIPVLAGVDKSLLLERLNGFRSGSRPASVMHQHAKGYTDRELELLADYFSKQPRPGQ